MRPAPSYLRWLPALWPLGESFWRGTCAWAQSGDGGHTGTERRRGTRRAWARRRAWERRRWRGRRAGRAPFFAAHWFDDAFYCGEAEHGHGAGSLRATRCSCWDFGRRACRGGRGERLWWRSNLGLLDPLAAHGVVLSYGDGTRLGAAFAKFQNDARGRAADARRASGGARRSGHSDTQRATAVRAQSSPHERLAVRMQGRRARD